MPRKFFLHSLVWASVYAFFIPIYATKSYKGKEEKFFKYLKKRKNRILDRSMGLVMGAAIGDTLGSYTEFMKKVEDEKVNEAMQMPGGGTWGVAPGQITDDTELSISLSRGLCDLIDWRNVENSVYDCFDFHFIAKHYFEWLESHPFDVGFCTRTTLTRSDKSKVNLQEMKKNAKYHNINKVVKHKNGGNIANGSAMRCMPLILYAHKLNSDQLFALMAEDSSLTHANPVVYFANTFYAIAIKRLLNSNKPIAQRQEKIKEAIKAAEEWLMPLCKENKAAGKVHRWFKNAEGGDITKFHNATYPMGYLRIAFERTFYHLIKGSSFKEAMMAIIKEGGDTDTNCCIAAAAIAASYGYKELRNHCPEYFQKVIECDQSKGRQGNRGYYHPSIFIETIPKIVDNAPKSINKINGKDIKEIIASRKKEQLLSVPEAEKLKKLRPKSQQNLTRIAQKPKNPQKSIRQTSGGERGGETSSNPQNNELSTPTFLKLMFGLSFVGVLTFMIYSKISTFKKKKGGGKLKKVSILKEAMEGGVGMEKAAKGVGWWRRGRKWGRS